MPPSSSSRTAPRKNAEAKAAAPVFLPPQAREALVRFGRRLWGVGLLLLAGLLGVSLGSFHPADPSLNTASTVATQNLLGTPGAMVADLLVQGFGAAAVILCLAPLLWSLRILAGGVIGWAWARGLVLILALLLLSMALAILPVPAVWPLSTSLGPTSLGGTAGLVLLALAQDGAVALGATVTLYPLFALCAALLGLPALVWALALRRSELAHVAQGLKRLVPARTAPDPSSETEEAPLPAKARPRAEPSLSRAPHREAPEQRHEPTLAPLRAEAPAMEEEETENTAPSLVVTPPDHHLAPSAEASSRGRQTSLLRDTTADGLPVFELPPLHILAAARAGATAKVDEDALSQNARMLEGVLRDFGVQGEIVHIRPGPVVTLYELEPAPGTKTARVIGLADDIARSMSAISVRIAVVPGRSVIGIELPNARRDSVNFRELLASDAFHKAHAGQGVGPGGLTLALGRDIGGAAVFVDLSRMPHLLIAGTTGSGKSVAINTMICSLIYRLKPSDCRFIMIDPKMLELSVYDGIPHLLTPVVTDPAKAVVALKWAVKEMENRYRAMSQLGVRNIAGYNGKIQDALERGETLSRTVQTGFDPDTGKPVFEQQSLDMTLLPFIVVVVDEMADLMLVAGKDVEAAIQRLAQMARAAGIHLIMATQRPSVDVITGTIKANFPTRISFQVTSKIDSRTILGEQGAEQLLGQGDMLYMAAGGRITRVHGPFVADAEVEAITGFLREQAAPDYIDSVINEEDQAPSPLLELASGGASSSSGGEGDGDENALFDQAVALVAREQKVSISFIQRHFQIGYNRAARLVERMEAEGMISRANRTGKREVLVPPGPEERE